MHRLIVPSLALALGCTPAPEPGAAAGDPFETVLGDLDGNANAVYAPSREALYVVGGRQGRGMILRLDGSRWVRMAGGGVRELFAVWGAGDAVWAVGDGGAILREQGDAWVAEPSGTGAALRGVWGASADEAWAVGDGGTVLWRAGGAWSPDRVSGVWSADLARVWGDADSAWIVGRAQDGEALVLGRAGGDWNRVPSGVAADLAGVHGRDGEFFAVGQASGGGVVLRNGGAGWAPAEPAPEPLAGVCVAPDAVFAVGAFGYAARAARGADASFAAIPTDTDRCLRAVWGDDLWGVWAVGGACPGAEVELGVVLHRGERVAGGPIVNEDSGGPDGPPPDGGVEPDADPGLGPGEECPSGGGCEPPLQCWFVRPAPTLFLCTHPCGSLDDCAEFESPCCQDLEQNGVPAASVCVPRATGACTE